MDDHTVAPLKASLKAPLTTLLDPLLAAHAETRPPRRRRLVPALAVVLLGPVAAGSAAAAQHARSLDAAARQDVGFTASLVGPDPSGVPVLRLVSTGRQPVVVTEVRPQAPEYDGVPVGTTLPAGGSLELPLAPSRCEHLRPTDRVDVLDVAVVTARHETVHHAVWASPQLAVALGTDLHSRCGFPPEQALSWRVLGSRITGDTLEVTYALTDRSLLPVTVGYLTPLSGLRLDGPPLPLTLTAAPAPATQVMMRFRIADCSALLRAAGAGVPWGVQATFSVDDRIGQVPMLLTDPRSGQHGQVPDPLRRLAGVCRPG